MLDNTMPIMVGNQRIGGVRVGMALDEVQQREQAANATLGERLLVGSRHLGWLLLMLGLLVVIGVVVIMYVQRTLVAPIRDLAAAARRIEAGTIRHRWPRTPVTTKWVSWCAASPACAMRSPAMTVKCGTWPTPMP